MQRILFLARGGFDISAESLMSKFLEERVTGVHHWTESLFSFTTTRSPAFRFRSGEFTMIGIPVEGKPLLRAYSVASAHYADELEFFSIKVQNGPLTSRLQHLKEGDAVMISQKATGTLVLDNLAPGKHLYLLGTGTGLAPFLSLIKDPETYDRFEKVIVVHGVRMEKDLAYSEYISEILPKDELIGELVREQLIYYPTVTREDFRNRGRITALMESGKLFSDVGLPPMSMENDRFMLCGSPEMIADVTNLLKGRHYIEGNHGEQGHFVVEKAFVEK